MRVPFALVLLALCAAACASGNSAVGNCPAGRTLLDGVCVAEQVADYVACVRAQGAELASNDRSKLSADVGAFGQHAALASDVQQSLERKYSTSDANTLEVIRACNDMRGGGAERGPARTSAHDSCVRAGRTMTGCGYEEDAPWLEFCESKPDYIRCLERVAGDCNALSLCGFQARSILLCAGHGEPTGQASCRETLDCHRECSNDACDCSCSAKMAAPHATEVGILLQCARNHCPNCNQSSQACTQCFARHCGAKYDRLCLD